MLRGSPALQVSRPLHCDPGISRNAHVHFETWKATDSSNASVATTRSAAIAFTGQASEPLVLNHSEVGAKPLSNWGPLTSRVCPATSSTGHMATCNHIKPRTGSNDAAQGDSGRPRFTTQKLSVTMLSKCDLQHAHPS